MEQSTTPNEGRPQPNIPAIFLKPYEHAAVESTWYSKWESEGYFNPDICIEKGYTQPDAEVFSMVLPPPNVTGTLHCGHALMLVVEDIMTRYARMNGKRTLWLPGTDHAAIATQSKVEKELAKDGVRRHDLGREEFLKKVNEFAQGSHDTIVSQVRAMGASVDWSREAFTLDEERNLAVRTAFKKMYDDGLIYRKEKVVNWDPKGQTVISDDEIVYEEKETTLYTFKYSKDFPISIATTRPETKLGDTAVAVNPKDTRYASLIGKTIEVPDFCGTSLSIQIVGDAAVEMEFGTGAVGVTPAHSHTDADIASRHNLPSITVIDEYAKITCERSLAHGLKVAEAREKVVTWLRENGLIEKEEKIKHNVATAERTGGVIEPLPKLQWWIDVNKEFNQNGTTTTLKKIMTDAVKSGNIRILPGDRFERVYFNWIENLHDWCISRQIWYGHRIPVWYSNGEIVAVGITPDQAQIGWTQDEDTLDTWFSAGLWTFSTLGWPNEDEFAKNHIYHPTSVLETGYDILFFWVARMILMSGYLLGEVPFKAVYMHGLVRDSKGRKMSKSLGNIIDPLEFIQKYGADSLRMALIVGNGPGNDLNLSEDKIRAYRKFSNKLWNIARFVLESIDGADAKTISAANNSSDTLLKAEWLSEFDAISNDVTSDIESYRYYLASEKLYHYIWHTFADKIIEEAKPLLADSTQRVQTQATLLYLLRRSLTLLHPFMPFITEEIWSHLPSTENQPLPLIIRKWQE